MKPSGLRVTLRHSSGSVDELRRRIGEAIERRLEPSRFVTFDDETVERIAQAVVDVVSPPVFSAHWLVRSAWSDSGDDDDDRDV